MNRGVADLFHALLDEGDDLKVGRADDETLGFDPLVIVRRGGRFDAFFEREFAREKRDRLALILRGIDEKDVFVGNRDDRRLGGVERPAFGVHAAEFVEEVAWIFVKSDFELGFFVARRVGREGRVNPISDAISERAKDFLLLTVKVDRADDEIMAPLSFANAVVFRSADLSFFNRLRARVVAVEPSAASDFLEIEVAEFSDGAPAFSLVGKPLILTDGGDGAPVFELVREVLVEREERLREFERVFLVGDERFESCGDVGSFRDGKERERVAPVSGIG